MPLSLIVGYLEYDKDKLETGIYFEDFYIAGMTP
jgi:hypothetical protein